MGTNQIERRQKWSTREHAVVYANTQGVYRGIQAYREYAVVCIEHAAVCSEYTEVCMEYTEVCMEYTEVCR